MCFYLVDTYKNNILPVALQIAFLERLANWRIGKLPGTDKTIAGRSRKVVAGRIAATGKVTLKPVLFYLYGFNPHLCRIQS